MKGDGPGLFVRLDDGDSVRGVFMGQPYARRVVWDEAQNRSVKFNPDIHPEREGRFKVSWNFYDADQKDIRILELSKRTFGMVVDLTERLEKEGSALDKWECKVARRGVKKDTQYWVDTVRELPDEVMAKLTALFDSDQHDLEAIMNDGQVALSAKESFTSLADKAPASVAVMAAAEATPAKPSGGKPDFDLF